jgi:hypothetical protein
MYNCQCLRKVLLRRNAPADDPIFEEIDDDGIDAVPNGYMVPKDIRESLDNAQLAILHVHLV